MGDSEEEGTFSNFQPIEAYEKTQRICVPIGIYQVQFYYDDYSITGYVLNIFIFS